MTTTTPDLDQIATTAFSLGTLLSRPERLTWEQARSVRALLEHPLLSMQTYPTLDQSLAVEEALRSAAFCFSGGPGTGKTFAADLYLRACDHLGSGVLILGPTGKAVKRAMHRTGRLAMTLQRWAEGGVPLERHVVLFESAMASHAHFFLLVQRCIVERSSLLVLSDPQQGVGSDPIPESLIHLLPRADFRMRMRQR